MRGDWLLAGGVVRPSLAARFYACGHPGCSLAGGPTGLCPGHARRYEELGMGVKPGTHVRSLRMPQAEADAIGEGARRLGIPQQEFIRQACRFVLREAGIFIPEPTEPIDEDPFR